MITRRTTVLLVDPDAASRAQTADALANPNVTVLQVEEPAAALRILSDVVVNVLMTELYLNVGEEQCLIYAVRKERKLKGTRIIALTHGARPYDRDWARRAGADAYLIKPSRAERVRYVVQRLAGKRAWGAARPAVSAAPRARLSGLATRPSR